MNPNDIAPMVMVTTLIVVGGGVLLLRPIAKRIGEYLQAVTRSRLEPAPPVEPRIVETLERVEERLRLLEERQDFTEALLNRGRQQERLEAAPPGQRTGQSDLAKD